VGHSGRQLVSVDLSKYNENSRCVKVAQGGEQFRAYIPLRLTQKRRTEALVFLFAMSLLAKADIWLHWILEPTRQAQ